MIMTRGRPMAMVVFGDDERMMTDRDYDDDRNDD